MYTHLQTGSLSTRRDHSDPCNQRYRQFIQIWPAKLQ